MDTPTRRSFILWPSTVVVKGSMIFFLVFMGFLALLSGYIVSLEDRFKRDGLFCPFSLTTNLRASLRARKVMTWLGVLIWAFTAVFYLFTPNEPVSTQDALRLCAVGMIIYTFMLLGYTREREFKDSGISSNSFSYLQSLTRQQQIIIAVRAGWAISKILIALISLFLLKCIVGWAKEQSGS